MSRRKTMVSEAWIRERASLEKQLAAMGNVEAEYKAALNEHIERHGPLARRTVTTALVGECPQGVT